MELNRRRLGETGPEITTVGFGAWAVGGGGWLFGWGSQDDAASIAAIRHALELGVNWIDTAPEYGFGHSEEVVGRVLKDVPSSERPYVFTKCGLIFDRAQRFEESKQNLQPASIRRELENSLQRLGVEQIDLYQFHFPDATGTPVEDSWGEMTRFVEEGKVRWIGVSNFGVDLLERCERIRHVDSLQPPFSLIRRNSAADVIPWCAEHGTGVIVYSPMHSGVLTDSFSAEKVARLAEDDWRRRDAEFQSPIVERNIKLRNALKPFAQSHGYNVSSLAVAWTLAWPGVTGAIVGARSAEQVDGWIRAAQITLDPKELEQIAASIRETGAGSGPEQPVRATSATS